jgi:hypothetical protein
MNIINDNLSVTSVSATTYYNLPTEELTVYVINNITLPQKTIYITQPIITPQPHQRVEYITNYIQPEPIVINTSLSNVYGRICGSNVNSGNSKYVNCTKCVDRFLNDYPDKRSSMDLTSRATGCRFGMK